MDYLTKKLMKDIKRGGLVIAPRRSGKTVAAICFLQKNEGFILSCHSWGMARELQGQYPDVKDLIIGPDHYSRVGRREKIILDEAFWHPLFLKGLDFSSGPGGIHCALSSTPGGTVVYNEKGKRLELGPDLALETDKTRRAYNRETRKRRNER